MIAAASLPETFYTVWFNVVDRAELKTGESILIHGGSSGIGTSAIQICSQLGARVITTASTKEKCKVCSNLGAERTINYHEEDFVLASKDFTDGKGLDVVLDMVGGEYLQRNIKSLGQDGRHISIAFLSGAKAHINFMPIMLKRIILTGATLRPLSIRRKGEIADSLRRVIWPLIEKGKIMPVVHSIFSLEQATKAHALMESNKHIGKIILVP